MSPGLDIAASIYLLFAAVVAVLSSIGWGRYKYLHLATFVYTFLGYAIIKLFDLNRPFVWTVPLYIGIAFYIVAWGYRLQWYYEKKRRPPAPPPPGTARTFSGDDPDRGSK
jgi:hypothetical protein